MCAALPSAGANDGNGSQMMDISPAATGRYRLCQVHLERDDPGQPFARAHAERLPCQVSVVHGDAYRPLSLDDVPLRSSKRLAEFARLGRRALAHWRGSDGEADEITSDYVRAFRRSRCQAVLIEFGHVGVQAMDACRRLDLPMTVHFHGYDVYARGMLDRYGARYEQLFEQAVALIAPSRAMREPLLALGALAEKVHYVPCGVDPHRFRAGAPDQAPPTFLAVGRFVEKKAPQLTIAAFASVWRRHPEARLRMIGDGRLRGACEDLAEGLGMGESVVFLGTQPHDVIADEMRRARAFVQHSLVASDGNSEATPQSILEACASELPVVSTRHAGIPEAILEGETGFLVDERDVEGMARHMERLVVDPALAAELGRAGRRRVEEHFSMDSAIASLWDVIRTASGAEGTASH
jgi:colanic acid/amylovoran biosynthesis glycosyltransferase